MSMVQTIKALGIPVPNSMILVENILKNRDDPAEEIRILLSPGAEEGLDLIVKKYGYLLEIGEVGADVEARILSAAGSVHTVDVSGDSCPGPVITVSNTLGTLSIGERLKVTSTSADSIADIAVAVASSGSRVTRTGLEGELHYLIAEKGERPSMQTPGLVAANRDQVLIVQSSGTGNAERAYATFIFSKVAQSMGKKVTIFLLMDGVSLARKGNAAAVKHPDFDRLDHLMDEVVRAGATIYACELSAKFRGITAASLADGVKLAGAATYLQLLSDPTYAIVNF